MTEVRASGLAVLAANAFQSSSSEAKLTSLGIPIVHQEGLSGVSEGHEALRSRCCSHFNPEEARAEE